MINSAHMRKRRHEYRTHFCPHKDAGGFCSVCVSNQISICVSGH